MKRNHSGLAESGVEERKAKARDPTQERATDGVPDLLFEDPFEDSLESEEEEVVDAYQSDEDGEQNPAADILEEGEEEEEEKEVWLPSLNPLQEGETLEYDPAAYSMIHFITSQWPCLSFDVLPDSLGARREKYPHTMYLVSGTQAASADENSIVIMKLSDMCKTREEESSDGGFNIEGSSSGGDEDPVMETRTIPHAGTINRIRAMPQHPNIIACMNEDSSAQIYNISAKLEALDKPPARKIKDEEPVFTFRGHSCEGYALAWNLKEEGRLLTGDCANCIYSWRPQPTGWTVDPTPFRGHSQSVEDLQWSPSEPDVFSSCSVDGTVKLWDERKGKSSVANIRAHDSDVNVISWNPKRAFLILSGADDGTFKIWDLRNLKKPVMAPDYSFSWHKAAITSVEWNPNDDSTLAVASADNTISVWDLSLTPETTNIKGIDIPSQLMFVHHQQHIKEVHWHKQIPGVLISTGLEGFNVFKPFNLD